MNHKRGLEIWQALKVNKVVSNIQNTQCLGKLLEVSHEYKIYLLLQQSSGTNQGVQRGPDMRLGWTGNIDILQDFKMYITLHMLKICQILSAFSSHF